MAEIQRTRAEEFTACYGLSAEGTAFDGIPMGRPQFRVDDDGSVLLQAMKQRLSEIECGEGEVLFEALMEVERDAQELLADIECWWDRVGPPVSDRDDETEWDDEEDWRKWNL